MLKDVGLGAWRLLLRRSLGVDDHEHPACRLRSARAARRRPSPATYPEYIGDVVLDFVRACASDTPHIQLALEGRIDDACKTAEDDLAKEEHVSTLAVLGHTDQAIPTTKRGRAV